MITNKDIRVENGNLVLNGDKYPLDGQSPEAIMQIVEDNSDTTPTEDSIKPITSGGVWTALNNIPKMHIVHFEVIISDMTAWGSVFEKAFTVDISSLHLTNQPMFISMELLNPSIGSWLRGFNIDDTITSIGAVFIRPTVANGAIRGNVLIIE